MLIGEGLKYKEITEKLNISVKTVENRMGMAFALIPEMVKL
ncbi:sigma factor-like helix-turn-helix DNA-binding protein [Sinomicrobium sp. M5D2P9]